MFDFIEFLRVVAGGVVAYYLVAGIFYAPAFSVDTPTVLVASAMIGLLVQPFLRAWHPYRSDVKRIIAHVEAYVNEVFPKQGTHPTHHDPSLENALARAVYEYVMRTADCTESFTKRVNEQIRFFYFYYFISAAMKSAAVAAPAMLVFKYVASSAAGNMTASRIAGQMLLRSTLSPDSVVFVALFTLSAWLLSRRFASFASGIMLNELNTRHVFLVGERERILQIARAAADDPFLVDLLDKDVDKEAGSVVSSRRTKVNLGEILRMRLRHSSLYFHRAKKSASVGDQQAHQADSTLH